MPLDNDLQSIQEMRGLVQKAKQAQLEFRAYDQTRVDRIVKAMADAGYEAAERLGRIAHEETGFGKPEDKKMKNEFATRRVWESIKDLRSVGVIREDKEKRIIEIAEPMGVVCALIPSTNPTSTVMFKAIISVKGRNGIVASPHPRAAKCTAEAMHVVAQAAEAAGVDCIALCDTNGGNLPFMVADIIEQVKKQIKTPLGIHTHNDGECAVANSLIAVEHGIVHVQGTINGFGERCGNANLCSLIPNLQLKLGFRCVDDQQLVRLTDLSKYVAELANLSQGKHLPFVGQSAFAHKGGVHVSAVMKNTRTYEHIVPEVVGIPRMVVSRSPRHGFSRPGTGRREAGAGHGCHRNEPAEAHLREDSPEVER